MGDDVEANPEKHTSTRYVAALVNSHIHLLARLERSELPTVAIVLITP